MNTILHVDTGGGISLAGQLAFAGFLLLIAAVCLIFPRTVQAFYARPAKPESLRRLILSRVNLVLIRGTGIAALVASLVLLWATFWARAT